MSRLPTPGGDSGSWGSVLNDFLAIEHNSDGSLKKASDIAAAKAAASSAIQSINSKTGTSVSLSLNDIADVSTDSVADGQALVRSGSSWMGATVATAIQNNFPSTDKYVPRWDQTNSRMAWKRPATFDIRDYGALPNDTTAGVVNSAAIASAITAASAVSGTVQFVGLFTIDQPVAIKDNVTLEGLGTQGGVTPGNGRNVQPVCNFDSTAGNSNITLRNLYVNGNKAGNPTGGATAIRFLAADATPCQNIVVEGCHVDGAMFAGIMLQNVKYFRVVSNKVQDTERDGITIWFNSTDGVIADNVVLESGDDCIALNSEFTGHIGSKCERISITGNTVSQRYDGIGFGSGIHTEGVEDITISGNTVAKAMGPGILIRDGYVSGAAMPSKRIAITGNVCSDSRDASAIAIGTDCVGVSVVGNTVEGYTGQGIQCDAPVTVSGNYVLAGTTASSQGVFVSLTGTGTTITGNRFEGCAATGVTISAERCVVTGNTFKDCGTLAAGQAYCLISGNFNRTAVVGNIFYFAVSGAYGVRIASGTGGRNVVIGNTASGFAAGSSFSDGSTSGTNILRENSPSDDPITVASAATVRLDRGSLVYKISGTTNIDTITATGRSGDSISLIFTGALTVNDGTGNLKLNNSFTTTADDVLQLVSDGTSWFEVARSAN